MGAAKRATCAVRISDRKGRREVTYSEYVVGITFKLDDRPGRMPSPMFVGRLMESSTSTGVDGSEEPPIAERLFDGQIEWDHEEPVEVCTAKSRLESEIEVLRAVLNGPINQGLAENKARDTDLRRYDYATYEDLANGCLKRMEEVKEAQKRGDEHPPPLPRRYFN